MKPIKALAILAAVILLAGSPMHTLAATADATTAATQPANNNNSNSNNAPASPAAPTFSSETTYSLEEMLTYALTAEYTTEAACAAVTDRFGEKSPFTELRAATAKRIQLLVQLFEMNGFTLPENTAAEGLAVPASLSAAYWAGLNAEKLKVQMYEAFLAQSLPEDVRAAFEEMLQGDADMRDIFASLVAQSAPQGNNSNKDDDDEEDDDDSHEGDDDHDEDDDDNDDDDDHDDDD